MTPRSKSPSGSELGPDTEIPDKLYFKIGEAAQLVGVQAHVLRYWEKEIPLVRPGKTTTNQRRYRRRDLEIFREIKRLLHQERYTLAGARKRLLGRDAVSSAAPSPELHSSREDAHPQQQEQQSPQMPLGFSHPSNDEKMERLRTGLQELIRMSGEEP